MADIGGLGAIVDDDGNELEFPREWEVDFEVLEQPTIEEIRAAVGKAKEQLENWQEELNYDALPTLKFVLEGPVYALDEVRLSETQRYEVELVIHEVEFLDDQIYFSSFPADPDLFNERISSFHLHYIPGAEHKLSIYASSTLPENVPKH